MTFQLSVPIPEKKLVRIQEKGQVTLPVQVRKKLGLKKGDLVAIVATDDGVLITPQEVIATKALDRIGEILNRQKLSLDELIESGRKERVNLLERIYGIRPANAKE